MAKRIRYNKTAQPHLIYHSPVQYLSDAPKFTLPTEPLILVKHLNEFSLFVEVLVRDVFTHTDPDENPLIQAMKKLERLNIPLNTVFELAWNWFLEIEGMKGDFTGRLANARLLAWSQCCTLFYLITYSGDNEKDCELLGKNKGPASAFTYCLTLAEKDSNIVITDSVMNDYTVDELWLSMRLLLPTLYQNPYNNSMKQYLYALYFRYASFFTTKQNNLERLMDNPKFYRFEVGRDSESTVEEEDDNEEEAFDAFKKQEIPLGFGYYLTSDFFYEGELLFTSQLRRIFLSTDLDEHCKEFSFIFSPTQPLTLNVGLGLGLREGLEKMIMEVSVHGELRQSVNEEFMKQCLSLYIYHGEPERWKRMYPNMNTRASEILAQSRPSDLKHATSVMSQTITELVKSPNREREIVLLTKIITRQLLRYDDNKKAELINDSFILEELVSLDKLEELIERALKRKRSSPRRAPLLVKLVSTYYVIHEGFLKKSHEFVECYLVWLAILVKRLGWIQPRKIYPTIREFIKNFIPLD